jgi:hypothetical protein
VNVTLAVLGIVFLGAAAIGGGLKALGTEVPHLASGGRQLLLAVVGLVALAAAFVAPRLNNSAQSSSQSPTEPTVTGGTSPATSPATSASGKALGPTPVWTSANPILIPGTGGVDFDSNPPVPGSGPNTLILYGGNELYSTGSYKVATWTNNVSPTRDQCNALAQAQGNFEQPAETGGRYCLLTEQGPGHTVYLKITRIDASNTADITAYANAVVWNTTG